VPSQLRGWRSTTLPSNAAGSAQGAPAMAGGWTITNDFGDVINPWGPSGFSGVVDPRY
jgi:hypothetical protein